MNENMYEETCNKHYVRLDENNNIIEGWSDGPLRDKDTSGAICINEQGGYQFKAYPNGEENVIADDLGNPLYSYIDGEVVVNPPYEPDPAVILGQQKQAAIAQTKSWVASELDKPMQWTDGKLYTVTLEKQNLLSAQLGMYMMNAQTGTEYPLMWNASGEPCKAWTFEDLLTLSNAIAAYVAPIVSAQQYAEIGIRQAVNYEQIDEILQGLA